jgi:RimJ/RimL family protein N-acetyltransferase
VQYLFDARNPRAQRLCERLGARREGLLRKHRITASGYSRDSLVYSLLDSEWPGVRERLQAQLQRAALDA